MIEIEGKLCILYSPHMIKKNPTHHLSISPCDNIYHLDGSLGNNFREESDDKSKIHLNVMNNQ